MPSYYERVGEHLYRPTEHTGGAWREDEQHFSPVGGVIMHAVDRHLAARPEGPRLVVGRISFDILGQLGRSEMDIRVESVRPGRTIELLEATAVIAGRAAVRARVWLLSEQDTSAVAGGADDRLTPPDALPGWPMDELWSGGYIASLDVRPVGTPVPGRGTVWLSSPVTLVADEPSSPLASYVALVDTANGIAVRQPPGKWIFPNVDLTLHLFRQPAAGGRWVGLDTTVVFGAAGQGLTSTVLHDERGPLGRAEQMLTVRPLN
ncbi:thioesterase family protein [Streptomyces sp. NPDC058045]|uniref:thioesterase family protein n=1 Tax=Streptomyces sp. NPDC058045 TaxID=3346311 RepID=UPI0036EF8215